MTDETTTETTDDAPYGYKADGTPYKRRPNAPRATNRRKTSGNGSGSWADQLAQSADALNAEADTLEQAAADMRALADRLRP